MKTRTPLSTAGISTALSLSSVPAVISHDMVLTHLLNVIQKYNGGPIMGRYFFYRYIKFNLELVSIDRLYDAAKDPPNMPEYSWITLTSQDPKILEEHMKKLVRELRELRELNNESPDIGYVVQKQGILIKNKILFNLVISDKFDAYLKSECNAPRINFDGMPIGDSGAKEWAEWLKKNETLLELHINPNSITSQDARAIADAIKVNKTLLELHLSGNDIGDDGVEAIAEMLKENKKLCRLYLYSCGVYQNRAKVIAKALEENNTLQELTLAGDCYRNNDHNDVVESIAEMLKKNKTLLKFNFSDAFIYSNIAIAEALKENKFLCELDLSRCYINDDGAEAIAEMLKENNTLRELNLADNSISSVGVQSILDGLQENYTLRELKLDKSIFKDETILKPIEACLKRNRNLSRAKGASMESRSSSSTTTASATQSTYAKISPVLSSNSIEPTIISHDEMLVKLEEVIRSFKGGLILGKYYLCQYILNQANLNLKLNNDHSFYKPLRGYSLIALYHPKDVDSISNEDMGKMTDAFNSLNQIFPDIVSVKQNFQLIVDNMQLLKLIQSVEFYTYLMRQYDKPTIEIIDLSYRGMGNNGAKELADMLKKSERLRELCLNVCEIGDEGAQAIAGALKENKALHKIELKSNSIGYKGGAAIAEALKVNHTLEILVLSFNHIGDDGAKEIAKMLESNTALRELHLAGNEISDDGAEAIAKALKENKTLCKIDLGSNVIGNEGASAIAEALKVNDTVEELSLMLNHDIRNDGAKAIAKALKENKKLRRLSLVGCGIENKLHEVNDVATEILAAFEVNTTLRKFDLEINSIEINALIEIKKCLERNLQCSSVKGIPF